MFKRIEDSEGYIHHPFGDFCIKLVLTSIALLCLFVSLARFDTWYEVRQWRVVSCRMNDTVQVGNPPSLRRITSGYAGYTYTVDGNAYEGSSIAPVSSLMAIATPVVGTHATCLVNPNNPKEAVLSLGHTLHSALLFLAIGALIGAHAIWGEINWSEE